MVQTGFYFTIKHHLAVVEREAQTQGQAKRTLARLNLLLIDFFDYFEQCLSYCMEQTDRARARLEHKTVESKKMIAAFIAFMERERLDKEETEKIRRLSVTFIEEGDKLKNEFFDAKNPLVVLMFYNRQTGFRQAAGEYSRELISFARSLETSTNADYATDKDLSQRVDPWLDTAVGLNIAISLFLMAYFLKGTVSDLQVLKDNSRRLSDGLPLREALRSSDEIGEVDAKFHEMAQSLSDAGEKERLANFMIKSSAQRVNALIDSLPQALVTIGERGGIEAINPQAIELFGFTSSELLGKTIDGILPSLFDKDFSMRLPELVEKTHLQPLSLELENADKEIIPAEISVVAFDLGENVKYVAVISDVSEKRRLDMQKRDFYAMVSHDIRAPLMSIRASIQTIENEDGKKLSPSSRENLVAALDSSGRLVEMVKRLLDVEKFDLGAINLDYTPMSARALLEEAVSTLNALAKTREIDLLVEGDDVEIPCDRELIREVLENLISNAIKFSPEKAPVVVASRVDGDFLEISVKDKGPGIAQDSQLAIFERFHQVRVSDRKAGFGLGLSICKSIVHQHGGTIGVESEPAQGSRFWIKLPMGNA